MAEETGQQKETEAKQSGDTAELVSRLEQAEAQAREFKEMAQRVQADFLNYKRRIQEENVDRVKWAGADLIGKLLPVIDDLEGALGSAPGGVSRSAWGQGIDLIRSKLMFILEQEGLKRVETQSRKFDPSEHEVIAIQDVEGLEEGTIVAVHQQGYRLNGKLLRPARVSVAKGPPSGQGPWAEDACQEQQRGNSKMNNLSSSNSYQEHAPGSGAEEKQHG